MLRLSFAFAWLLSFFLTSSYITVAQQLATEDRHHLESGFEKDLRLRLVSRTDFTIDSQLRRDLQVTGRQRRSQLAFIVDGFDQTVLIDRVNRRWQITREASDIDTGKKIRWRLLWDEGRLYTFEENDGSWKLRGVESQRFVPQDIDHGLFVSARVIPVSTVTPLIEYPKTQEGISSGRSTSETGGSSRDDGLVFIDSAIRRRFVLEADLTRCLITKVDCYSKDVRRSSTQMEYSRRGQIEEIQGWKTQAFKDDGELLYSAVTRVTEFKRPSAFSADEFERAIRCYVAPFDGSTRLERTEFSDLFDFVTLLENKLGKRKSVKLDLDVLVRDSIDVTAPFTLLSDTRDVESILTMGIQDYGLDFYVNDDEITITSLRETSRNHIALAVYEVSDTNRVAQIGAEVKREIGELQWDSHGGIGTFIVGASEIAVAHTPSIRMRIERAIKERNEAERDY